MVRLPLQVPTNDDLAAAAKAITTVQQGQTLDFYEHVTAYKRLIIDEVSMVGLVMMSQLFDALDANTKLILLGDKDQLPSVDAGAVLLTVE